MHISRILLSGVALSVLAGFSAPHAIAEVMTVGQIMRDCPDIDAAIACPALAEEFLIDRPMGPTSDSQIIMLVVEIAEAAAVPRVRLPVCLNAADGLRVLADGIDSEGQAAEVQEIADTLCLGTSTAALSDLSSATSTGSGGGNAGDVDAGDDDGDPADLDDASGDGDGIADDDGGDLDEGGPGEDGQGLNLGSNNASNGNSQNGAANANENATKNTSGKNGL